MTTDSKRGWLVVLASFTIHFIMDGITYSMGQVFLEPMRQKLSQDRASVSAIFGILPAVTLGAGPIGSALTNMYGYRAVAIGGTCVASLGFFLSRWWANFWFYYITIGIIGGLGFALMYVAAIVSVTLHFEKKRAFALGIAVSGSGVGTFILSYIMDVVVHNYAWISYPNALMLQAFFILFGIICGLLMIPPPQNSIEQQRHECTQIQEQVVEPLVIANPEVNLVPDTVVKTTSLNKSFYAQLLKEIDLNLFKNCAFILYTASNFLSSIGFNAMYNYTDDLANDANIVKEQRKYIVMSIGLFNILGRIVIGHIGDRKSVNHLFLFISSSIISGVATIVAPFSGSFLSLHIIYASVFGFFSGGYVTLTAVVLVDIVGIEKVPDGLGLMSLFVGIAAAIGTPLVGAMRDAFSHLSRPFLWPYAMCGVCTIISGVILFIIPTLKRQ